ncbi:MAG: crosslink repair DNA glycosylase YcaQ family protein [Bacteroidota bacterium]
MLKPGSTIDQATARAFAIDQQNLAKPNSGLKGTLAAIEQIGYVQIDTISVVQRAHHHVLWSRVSNYQAQFLKELEEKHRQVFEYWAHAASYLPMRDYRFSLVRKKAIAAGTGHWSEKDPRLMAYVRDRIRAEGPLMSRDFKKGKQKDKEAVWSIPPVNRALRQLFMEGQLMVSGRKGFQKIFDLTERVLPEGVNQQMPSTAEYFDYLIQRDIGAHGLLLARDLGHLLRIDRKQLKNLLHQKVLDGQLTTLHIKGIEDGPFYALPEKINTFLDHPPRKKLHLLSPFDNLIIQRKRLGELFDFQYLLECYVPEKKRKVGYFSLPLLWGKHFIAQLDLKADRKNKQLIIKQLVLEDHFRPSQQLGKAFRKLMKRFMLFNDCDKIVYSKTIAKQLIEVGIEPWFNLALE